MALPFYNWSRTASNNATADSSVNWAEGQAPSSVNDSARAQMASAAKWRDDLNGSITTGGSSTAYTVTSLGAKPLRSAPGVELPSGVLIQGTPYVATYYTSNSGEWILHDFYGNP